jgi:hypothetical protein
MPTAPDNHEAHDLADLQTAPTEAHNIAAQHPDIVNTMLARLAESHTPHTGVTLSPKDRAAKK